jgi:hypothetical protein
MPFYPNQRPPGRAFENAKRLNDQVLADQRAQRGRDAARKLRVAVDDTHHRLKRILKDLEHLEHGRHEDHRMMDGAENFDDIARDLEKISTETHTEIQHNPASHFPEYQQGGHPEAGLFQLIGMIIIILRRIQHLRSHMKSGEARRKAADAKRAMAELKAIAKRR